VTAYYAQFYNLPPLMQGFTRAHECAHHWVGFSEVAANCAALRELRRHGLTEEDEDSIAAFHRSVGPLPSQYLGSGVGFWNATISCAGPRRSVDTH